ncbi:MAG: cobalamin biosynthesis protein CobD [Acidobacteria bacterium]|nr:cobalamin biosynthesis protein CobD [Acidobacteriota bacterium]
MLDLVVGDPEWFPHPVRAMGKAIRAGERLLRTSPGSPPRETAQGAALSVTVISGAWAAAKALLWLSGETGRRSAALMEVALAWTTLATRSLLQEAGSVLDALDAGDLPLARTRLSRIVGRDTVHLGEAEIARAVIETAAESACDGIMAPLMWLAIGGVPLAFAYKAVNTLDSMIGHPEPPYTHFGRFAARFDDAANYGSARLTALSIIGAALLTGHDAECAWRRWRRDGSKHASPNAGQSEAAMAGALGVRLGGANRYDGKTVSRPLLNPAGWRASRKEARASLRIAATASALACGAAFLFGVWIEKRRRTTPL